MNQVNLIGRLTRDPELRTLGDSEREVCDLRLAVDNGRNRNGVERDPTFVDVATSDRAARAAAEHLRKGRQVAVSGRLVYREWEAEDSSKRSRHSVVGRVEFLGSAPDTEDANREAGAPRPVIGEAGEEIPF